ncbi:MAG TPA: PEP-CTERM sorting domain-containing protein [Vicinamibacterales bacterium]
MSLTNTSTFDGRITGLGFDLVSGDFSGNSSSGLNGFAGTSSDAAFLFSDAALGNVPQFSLAVLDFGYTTGNSGSFSGGSPNDGIAPSEAATFMVTGNFAGLTEAQVASALFVRFQRLGPNGEGSDVGRVGAGSPTPTVATPEPASMILLGTGLLVALRARRRLT